MEALNGEHVAVVVGTDVKPFKQEVAPVQIFPAVLVQVPGLDDGDGDGVGVEAPVGAGVPVGSELTHVP